MSVLTHIGHDAKIAHLTFGFFDDFLEYVDADLWNDIDADSGADVAIADALGGEVTITTGAVDNNECYLISTNELFKFAADKPLVLEARIKYTEANTDDANVFVGLANNAGANLLQDNGAGPLATYSGCCFFKADGDTVWSAENSDTSNQKTTSLTAANSLTGAAITPGGGSYQRLRIEVEAISATDHRYNFYVDGEHVARHIDQDISNATEMNFAIGAKAGSANSEVVTVDYAWCYQKRT